jgi:hypothetical protein
MISILTSAAFNVVKPTAKLAYPDLKVGIPSLLLCIEMAIFAFLHLFAFPWRPYSSNAAPKDYPRLSSVSGEPSKNTRGEKQGGLMGWRALVDAMNPWDLVKAFARSMRWLFVGRKHRENDSSYNRNLVDENDMVLEPSHTDGYKKNVNLPIADEFRRSRFGMPTTSDTGRLPGDEGAGLIAHAQPNPFISGTGYVPARHRYDADGREIGSEGYEKVRNVDFSPDRMEARDPAPPAMGYQPYSQENIGIAVGEPSPYESHVIQQPYPPPIAADMYVEQKRQDRRQVFNPSEQWANSSQPRDPNRF